MKAFAFFIVFIFLLIFADPAFAVSVNIFSFPATITDEPFTLTASISGATTGTNYLKVDIYKEGLSSYFGETFNGSDWYGGSSYSSYFPVTVTSTATFGAVLQARAGSPSNTQYDGTGTYKIRIRRYTSGGGYTVSEANASAVTISLLLPTPTPIPTDTPAPTSSTVSTTTPTKTPTATKTPTPIPVTVTMGSVSADILGDSTQDETLTGEAATPIFEKAETPINKQTQILGENNFPKIILSVAILLISACGILAIRGYRKGKNEIKNI